MCYEVPRPKKDEMGRVLSQALSFFAFGFADDIVLLPFVLLVVFLAGQGLFAGGGGSSVLKPVVPDLPTRFGGSV